MEDLYPMPTDKEKNELIKSLKYSLHAKYAKMRETRFALWAAIKEIEMIEQFIEENEAPNEKEKG